MIISCIVAMNQDRIIGNDNQIPWYLPADLKYFKKITTGHHILMGRKCYESIGKPLPNRTNIILTRNPYFVVSNCITIHTLEEGILIAKQNKENELFIIGGGEIYERSKHLWNKIYITEVDLQCEGSVRFPEVDYDEWKEIHCEEHLADQKNRMNYKFKIFERK
ncbi:MAG: dihydrofolate reductase [Saprospiraceae bacterium]|nr:dihydrofolate reductase [Saprospiraceae bacterium]MBK7465847.1 dihydrofolate reductase [Saprospiraceae bacterium]MBK9993754.1 dihydrofolate reductase [Saprospiraceae bacterium]